MRIFQTLFLFLFCDANAEEILDATEICEFQYIKEPVAQLNAAGVLDLLWSDRFTELTESDLMVIGLGLLKNLNGNWCDDIEKAINDGMTSSMSAASESEGFQKFAEGAIKEVMKLLNNAEDTKGRGRRDMIDEAMNMAEGMLEGKSESERKEIRDSDNRKEKKYHTIDRLSTATPLKNVKAMINELTKWLTSGDPTPVDRIFGWLNNMTGGETEELSEIIKSIVTGIRRGSARAGSDLEFSYDCKNIVGMVKEGFNDNQKMVYRMYNLYRSFYSDKNRVYGSIGRSFAAEYSIVSHMFTDTDACRLLIGDINNFIPGMMSALQPQMNGLMGPGMRAGMMDDLMKEFKSGMKILGKMINNFLKSDTTTPRRQSAMGGFTFLMKRAEISARMLAKAWPAMEEEFAFVPELTEMSQLMKMARKEMGINADSISADLVAGTTTLQFMAACGVESSCSELEEARDDLPVLVAGIDFSAYDEPATTASAFSPYQAGFLLFPIIFCY